MNTVTGGCHCGNIALEMKLTGELASYQPRACDCDFCRKHGSAYVSDAAGALRIRVRDERFAGSYRQGNELAEMFLCTHCGVLIGALFRSSERIYATVNARVIESSAGFGPEQSVSPKKLSGEDKVDRWKKLWFGDVAFVD